MPRVNNNVSPYQDPASYSNWSKEPVRNINWKELPPARTLNWYEITKTRNLVSNIFISLALVANTMLIFAASPIACASVIVVSAALFAAGIYLRIMDEHPLDPDFRMHERNKIKNKNQIPNVRDLDIYVNRHLITSKEMQALLHQDIYLREYNIFVLKHGYTIFRKLDEQNIELLKLKYLCQLSKSEITDLESILKSPENRYFKLTETDLQPFLKREEVKQEEEEQQQPSESMLSKFASKASSYVVPAFKTAANLMLPSSLKAAGQLAATSAQLAYQGKAKASMIYAANAATCLLGYAIQEQLKEANPEAAGIAKQQMRYERECG